MKVRSLAVALAVSTAITACSSNDSTTGSLKAPTVMDVMTMSGALHISWTNNESACDAIEGERKAMMADGSMMEAYKVVFSVPGSVDNKMDTTATDSMMYTYRVRCKKGTAYSDYSNEKGANPKP